MPWRLLRVAAGTALIASIASSLDAAEQAPPTAS